MVVIWGIEIKKAHLEMNGGWVQLGLKHTYCAKKYSMYIILVVSQRKRLNLNLPLMASLSFHHQQQQAICRQMYWTYPFIKQPIPISFPWWNKWMHIAYPMAHHHHIRAQFCVNEQSRAESRAGPAAEVIR
jgi:hypothetical protein